MFQKLWDNFQRHNVRGTYNYLYEKVLPTGKYAFSSDRTYFLGTRVTDDCSVLMLKETFLPSGTGIAVPKGSPLKEHIDKVYVT